MKYYKLNRGGGERLKYPEPELFGEWEEEPLFSNDWENRNLKLPVTMYVKNKYNPGDYPLAGSKLVSQKLLDIIKQLNKDYKAFPTQLYYKEKDPIWDIYYSMIFPECEAFNFEKSEYDAGIDGEGIGLIDNLVLSKEKLSHMSVENNIFALKETPVIHNLHRDRQGHDRSRRHKRRALYGASRRVMFEKIFEMV